MLIGSAILDLEDHDNADSARKTVISEWKSLAAVDVETTVEVEGLAITLAEDGLKPMDARHVTSKIDACAEYVLATEKQILCRMKGDTRIQILSPGEFNQ